MLQIDLVILKQCGSYVWQTVHKLFYRKLWIPVYSEFVSSKLQTNLSKQKQCQMFMLINEF